MEAWMAKVFALAEKAQQKHHAQVANDERHELIENSVTKSNALARAHYRLNLNEKRLMEALISQVNPLAFNIDEYLEVKTIDYARTFNIDEKNAYKELRDAQESLYMRDITITENINGELEVFTERLIIGKGRPEKGTGKIKVKFNPSFKIHLIQLKRKFTNYPLANAVDFKSSYTWRLYEIMVSWAQDRKITDELFMGWFTVSVDEFRRQLGVSETYNFGMFDKTLTKATDELWEKARIKTVITRIKTSRKITHLKFEFCENKQSPSC